MKKKKKSFLQIVVGKYTQLFEKEIAKMFSQEASEHKN